MLVGYFNAKVELVLERQGFLVLSDRSLARSRDLDLMLISQLDIGDPTFRQGGARLCHCEVCSGLAPLCPDMSLSNEELRVTLVAELRGALPERSVVLLVQLARMRLVLTLEESSDNLS